MNLYLIKRTDFVFGGEFDKIIVAATSKTQARTFKPKYSRWPLKKLRIILLGTATPTTQPGIILGSFNAV